MFLYILVGSALVVLFVWLIHSDNKLEAEQEEAKKDKERHEAWQKEYEAKEEAYRNARTAALEEMEAKWGRCTKDIFVNRSQIFTLKDRVYAFEEAEKIILGGNAYDFKDVIGVSLVNHSKTIYNAYTTGSSQKDLGNMIGRGLVGKMIGGNVGAAIGAMSAEDELDYETEYESEVENDYKVYVNIDSISTPTVTIEIGENEDDAYEITNLLNVIIRRNSIKD